MQEMDLQISHGPQTQRQGFFDALNIKELVRKSILKSEKKIKGQFMEQTVQQKISIENQIMDQSQKYSFDTVPKTVYFLDHQLLSSDQNVIEESLFQLRNFFQFLLQNPNHNLTNGQIVKLQTKQDELHNKISIQTLNPLIARMLDIFLNSKIFVFKSYIAEILIKYSFLIKQIFIKDELLQVLNKGIKGYDEYTRIMSVKIVPSFIEMFEKDLIGFQYILHKVQSFDHETSIHVSFIVQKLSFVNCLKQMLQKSQVLSSFFIKNIQQEAQTIDFQPSNKCLFINEMSILRFYDFCLHLRISTVSSLSLFRNIVKIYKNRSNIIQNIDLEVFNKLKEVVSKLFQKLFQKNFQVLKLFFNEGLQNEISLNSEIILKKFTQFDPYQQKYILEGCTQQLKQLLNLSLSRIHETSNSFHEKLFYKFYQKINSFEEDDHLEDQQTFRKKLILKQRRLDQFMELCESLKHQQIVSLIKIWMSIYNLIQIFSGKNDKSILEKVLSSTKLLIQQTVLKYSDLEEQLYVAAEMFILLDRSLKSDQQIFLRQDFWVNIKKVPLQNQHFLKWTHFSQNTLLKLNV